MPFAHKVNSVQWAVVLTQYAEHWDFVTHFSSINQLNICGFMAHKEELAENCELMLLYGGCFGINLM